MSTPATIMSRDIEYAYEVNACHRGPVAPALSEDERNRIDNYIISLCHVEDDELKVSIALELFTWLDECYPIREALFAPENDDLFADFACLVEDLKYVHAYAVALNANSDHDLTDSEIRNFVRCWEAVLKERARQLAEDVAAEEAYAAKYCRRCDEALEALEADADGYRYCHYCTLAQIDAKFS